MKAFEVYINGEKKCVAGVSDDALMTVIMGWMGSGPDLHVGGLKNEEHLHWLEESSVDLNIGDEVTIRAVEVDAVDEPTGRHYSQTRAEGESEVRAHLTAARDLMPSPPHEADDTVSIKTYNARLQEGHLIGAADVLAALGEINAVTFEFWREVGRAYHELRQYEDEGRYLDKYRAMKPQTDEMELEG